MRFLVVDDVRLILEENIMLLREIMPDCEVFACTGGKEALEIAAKEQIDVAFLDIELGTMNGIALARQLKDLQPQIHIIFITSFSQYALEAFSVHATGYLLKPVQKDQIKRELTFLYGETQMVNKRIKVQTFGHFEVWADGEILSFGRQKAKELFAYLVAQRGAGVTTREAFAVLFEDNNYDRKHKSYFQTIVAEMRNTLKKAGAQNVIIKSYNSLAVDAEQIDCDYYRFLQGDVKVINSYVGEFMTNYSWSEFLISTLNSKKP